MILSSGCGTADMANSNLSFIQMFKHSPVEDFTQKTVSFEMLKDPITGYRDSTALLFPVLQCVQPEINVLCYIFLSGDQLPKTSHSSCVSMSFKRKTAKGFSPFAMRR